jgi:hypothetical protein
LPAARVAISPVNAPVDGSSPSNSAVSTEVCVSLSGRSASDCTPCAVRAESRR